MVAAQGGLPQTTTEIALSLIEVSARLLPGFFSRVGIFGNFVRVLP